MTKIFKSLVGNSIRIFLLMGFGITFAFLVQSWDELTSPIELTLFTGVEHPLVSWLVLSFLLGSSCHFFLTYNTKRALKKNIKDLSKQNSDYIAELAKLRNLSLTDDIESTKTVNPPITEPEK